MTFIKYGRWDTPEHAKNGTKDEKIVKARMELYKVHQKAKELINADQKRNQNTRKAG